MTKPEMIALLRTEAAEKLAKAKDAITLEYHELWLEKAKEFTEIADRLEAEG